MCKNKPLYTLVVGLPMNLYIELELIDAQIIYIIYSHDTDLLKRLIYL